MRRPIAALVVGALGLAVAMGGIACKDPYSAKVRNGVRIPPQASNIAIKPYAWYAATEPIITYSGCSNTLRCPARKFVAANLLLTGRATLGDYVVFEAWSCNPNKSQSESHLTGHSGPQVCDSCTVS